MTKSTKADTWEAEFDEKFTFGGITGTVAFKEARPLDVKNFIRSLIAKDRATLKKRVEDMKLKAKHPYLSDRCQYCHEWLDGCECPDYNQAIDDVLALLGDTEEEK